MTSRSLVALVCCAFLSFFQNVAAGPLEKVDGNQERTLDFPDSYSFKGTVDFIAFNLSFAIWVSEPLNSMKMRFVLLEGEEWQFLLLGNEGTYGSFGYYTTLFGDEICNFFKGTPDKPITVKSNMFSEGLHFDDVQIVKGEELEKWVDELEESGDELYIKRNENGVVPVGGIVTITSEPKLYFSFNIRECSSKPVPESVFAYDSSSPCTEEQVSNTNIMSPELTGKLMKRGFYDESHPLNIMSRLIGHYYV